MNLAAVQKQNNTHKKGDEFRFVVVFVCIFFGAYNVHVQLFRKKDFYMYLLHQTTLAPTRFVCDNNRIYYKYVRLYMLWLAMLRRIQLYGTGQTRTQTQWHSIVNKILNTQ